MRHRFCSAVVSISRQLFHQDSHALGGIHHYYERLTSALSVVTIAIATAYRLRRKTRSTVDRSIKYGTHLQRVVIKGRRDAGFPSNQIYTGMDRNIQQQ